MRRFFSCLSALVCLLAMARPALAQPPADPVAVDTQIRRVALFKNGLGFFVREGELPATSCSAIMGPFAAPSHGTFWVSSAPATGLISVVARQVPGQEEVAARDLAELLRANVGREVTIWPAGDPAATIAGTILSFAPERPPRQRPIYPYGMGSSADTSMFLPPGRGQFVLIQTDRGAVALDPYRIARVDFLSPDIASAFFRQSEQVQLRAEFTNPRPGGRLSVSYLARGITWAPSYLIDISRPERARLTAKAVIFNEAEDLEATHIDLITGFPNLKFSNVLSPLAMRQDLAAFLRSLSGGGGQPLRASALTQVASFEHAARASGGLPFPDYGTAAAGVVAEDLFLYPVENVTLARGEIGYYPLFTQALPYHEFYQWDIPDYITSEDRYGRPSQADPDTPEIVWHSLRLTNTTELPWTTAPAQLLQSGNIIGQDMLNYTPPQAQATVRITQAVSIRAEQNEVEVERQREAIRMYGYSFDRVTIQGTLRVTNYKQETISLEITKTVSGDLKSTTPTAEDVTLARGLRRMNPVHHLTWTLDLAPEQQQEIIYTYDALIRR